jgi:hypothetical protein
MAAITMAGHRQARADTIARLTAQGYGRDHARQLPERWYPDEPAPAPASRPETPRPPAPVGQAHEAPGAKARNAGKGRTRVSVSGKAKPPGKPAVKPASQAEMRAWGREHGFKVNPRGSVSRRLRQEYQAAHGG